MEAPAAHRRILGRAFLAAGAVVLALAVLLEPERVARHHFRGHPTTELREETRASRGVLLALGALLVAGGALAPRVVRSRGALRACLVVLAAGVPLVAADRAVRPFVERRTALFVPDPELGWTHRPGAEDTYWGARFRINARGLRGPELARPKPPGTRRVVVLGDSVVFGLGLEDDADTLPARLERELAAAGAAVECVNAGVCGWSPWQAQRWLEREGFGLEPDLVVLGFVLNDLTERFRLERFGGATPGAQLEYARPADAGALREWLGESGILLALRELRLRARHRAEGERVTEYHAILEPGTLAVEEAWRLVADELAALRDGCVARDVPLLVVVFPYALQLSHPAYDAPQRRLAEETRRLALPLVDLLPPLAAPVQRGEVPVEALFLDGVHPSAAGHALAAREIARAVVAGDLLP